ncbi:MAG: hypothetical protein GXO25_06600 [Euryarchaeota archaeon]|nr:hypothetical protein [Euryarchaeota archaeon]
MREKTPPVITKFTVQWVVKYSLSWTPVQVYAQVHLIVKDVGGISYVDVLDEDSGKSVELKNAGQRVELKHKFSASLWQAGVGSVHIEVTAVDHAGNYISAEKELKGAFGQILDALAKIWNAIWSTLEKVAKDVEEGMNVFLQWLIQMVNSTVNRLLGPLISAYESWQNALILTIKEGENEYNSTGTVSHATIKKFNELIGGTLFWILTGIAVGLIALSLTLNALTFGSASVISMVIAPIVTIAILSAFSVAKERKSPLNLSGVGLSVNSIWVYLSDMISGKQKASADMMFKLEAKEENPVKTALEIDAIIFKSSAVIREWLEISIKDITGFTAKGIAFICGVMSVLLAITGLATHIVAISVLALAIGFTGLLISAYNFFENRPAKFAEKLVSILTLGLAGTGISLAISSLYI